VQLVEANAQHVPVGRAGFARDGHASFCERLSATELLCALETRGRPDELHPASRIGRNPALSQQPRQLGVAKLTPHVNPKSPDAPLLEVLDGGGHSVAPHADRPVQEEVVDPGGAQEGRFAPIEGPQSKPPAHPPGSAAIKVAPSGAFNALTPSNQLLHGSASEIEP
jgi:hypothetical protein